MKISDNLIPLFLIDLVEDGEPVPASSTISQNNLGQVLPTYMPKFIKKRKKLIEPYKDFRASKAAEAGWRSGRYNHLRGIRAFARSVGGKKFHRNLANFLTNREPGHLLNRFEAAELCSLLSSFRTHALLELNYYKPLTEEVDFFNAIEALLVLIDGYTKRMVEKLVRYDDFILTEEFVDNLIRIMEPAGIIHSLALKSGKSDTEVEKMWSKAKDLVKEKEHKSEDDNGYYALVVGYLKNMLGIKPDENAAIMED